MPRNEKPFAPLAIILICLLLWLSTAALLAQPLNLMLRRLVEDTKGSGQWKISQQATSWEPSGTAVVICDMWDQHWCKGATARVAEMAPRMNRTVAELRKRGVLIIHCPSETMKFYEGSAGRKLAQTAPVAATTSALQIKEPPLPIDDSDGGCDDEPQCAQKLPWQREISTIEIKDGDAITDNGEAYNLMRQRGVTNVLVMGVHENICVLGRPFSIRKMVSQGQNVVLVRDLTDTMYNHRRRPYVDHFTGNDLVCWHIEKYLCATITSDQIVGDEPFRFSADTKPPRSFTNSN